MMVNIISAATRSISRKLPLFSVGCLMQVLLVYSVASNSTANRAVASDWAWYAQASNATAANPVETSQRTSKTVLVLHSYHSEFPWTARVKAGIDQGFEESSLDITVYHEFLDTKRYPDLAHQSSFLDYVQNKYRNTPIDLLMVGDDPGLRVVMETREQYFSDLPVVFLGVNRVRPELLETPWLTGVFENHSILETLVEAKRQTGSDNLIVVVDSTSTGQGRQQKLEDLMEQPGVPQNIIIKTDLVAAEVTEALSEYPDNWPIYALSLLREDSPDGALLNYEKTAQLLSEALPNPVYADMSVYLGHGIVGGMLLDGGYHASLGIGLAEQILSGTPVEAVEPIVESDNQWMFDARELERTGLGLENLPSESILINLEPSFYKRYRNLVWSVAAVMAAGSVVITLLCNAIRRQQKAEQQVAERTVALESALGKLSESQLQLVQQEKMASLGNLVAGIAHEVNNPVGFLVGSISNSKNYFQDLIEHLTLYQQHYPDLVEDIQENAEEIDLPFLIEDFPKLLETMKSATTRIKNISTSLRTFSRADTEHKASANLHDSLDSTLLILKYRLKANECRPSIKVVKAYGTLPNIHCFPGQLNQVFMNLLANAIDVFDEAAIQTPYEALVENPQQITVKTAKIDQNTVEVRISDNGKGMTEAVKRKIFDRLFTTKDVGKGTGLGLAIAHQIIEEKHGGKITVES